MPSIRTRLVAIAVALLVTVGFFVTHSRHQEEFPSIASLYEDSKAAAKSVYDATFDQGMLPDSVRLDEKPVKSIVDDKLPSPTQTHKQPDTVPVIEASVAAPAARATESIKPPKFAVEDWSDADPWNLPEHYIYNDIENVHRRVSSVSTVDGKYFLIDFVNSEGYNPSIIPHHNLNDTYIVVSQHKEHSVEASVYWAQLVCTATFVDGVLKCLKEPLILPIAATFGEGQQCPVDMAWTKLAVGPHDARVFYGPDKPYVIYGSNSDHPCLGQWIQDFRLLMDWGWTLGGWAEFKYGTEMQRPDDWGYMEKNWFVFWDTKGQIYVHHDVYPKRVFAQLEEDGSVGPDLGPGAGDDKCMDKFMPAKAKVLEGIHQATNSLAITLCNRSDPSCTITNENTFIFTIFQHKSFYSFHGNYEPYVMVWQRTAPFSLHAISTKPIYINGRTRPGDVRPKWMNDAHHAQTEMFYVTSMSWKAKGQMYHGHIDDILFLAIGIEDSMNAGIDIKAGDLFLDLGLCSSL